MSSSLSDAAFAELTATAHAMADVARAPILEHFRSANLTADNKLAGGFDPVTVADRAAEAAMRRVLADRRRNDAILGEEEGRSSGTSGLTWVIDPIDGTRAFLAGAPTFGVLIALHDGDRPILGMVDQPYIGERFVGAPGRAAPAELIRRGERRALRTRSAVALSDAIALTTYPEVGTEAEGAAFAAVSREAKLTRYGLDCYGYMLVALGQADLVIEAGLQAYDIQGPMAVVQAAGGIVTDWSGDSCDQGGRALAAANAEIHEAALEILARQPFDG
ncbi:MAG: inositol monophosphatase family protein [Pseudomonadota bacterium]